MPPNITADRIRRRGSPNEENPNKTPHLTGVQLLVSQPSTYIRRPQMGSAFAKKKMEKASHKIVIGVAIMVIGTIIVRFTTAFTFSGAFHWIGRGFDACWNFAVSPVKISAWLLVLLVLMALALIVGVTYDLVISRREPSSNDYIKDTFDGLIWRWRYTYGGGIKDPWCFCPECDGILSYSVEDVSSFHEVGCRWATNLFCDHCDRIVSTLPGDQNNIVHRIERLIDRKIRVGEWREVVAQHTAKS